MPAIKTISDLLMAAVSTDSHRLILCGVCEDVSEEGTFRVATDTHRLVYVRTGDGCKKGNESMRVLYPEDVALAAVNSHYPSWRKVIPSESTRSVDLFIPSLRVAVTSALVAGRHNANRIKLKFSKAGLVVTGRCEAFGEAAFSLAMERPCGMEGFEIAFNGRYVLDSLPQFKNPEHAWIRLEMTESSRPATFSYPNAEGHWQDVRVVLMPMALG